MQFQELHASPRISDKIEIEQAVICLDSLPFWSEQSLDHFVFKAFGEPVGTISFGKSKYDNQIFGITNVLIDKKYQSQGFGRKMLTISENAMFTLGAKFSGVNAVNSATKFYEDAGYIGKNWDNQTATDWNAEWGDVPIQLIKDIT
ncbi:GNAT family N-acetyltransferase [Lentilitoribacter sp. EG35]|uniref:GNAT family N-acetyltransferase n=1 Tax=Lentilitoribacter sp. EG35 TaxID=3234192 RepID=UPI00345F8598